MLPLAPFPPLARRAKLIAFTGTSNTFTGVAKGDLDASGSVNVLDVTRTTRLALGQPVAVPPPAGFQFWAEPDGTLVVTLTLDRDTGTVRAGPELISRGVIEPELSVRLMADARKEVLDNIRRFAHSHTDISLLQETIHDAVSKTVYRQTRRRPMVIPVINEI